MHVTAEDNSPVFATLFLPSPLFCAHTYLHFTHCSCTTVCTYSHTHTYTYIHLTAFIFPSLTAMGAVGCMNNLTFGDDTFGYYETIAGGAGAGPTWEGTSGVHTHMTNTRITDPEILEKRYPTLLREFSLRKGSGGMGRHKGGDGVRRVIEFLRPMHVGILSQRRAFQPYGMYGGGAGERGRNLLQTSEKTVSLGGNNAVREALLPSHISSFPPPF
mmetsp:Transcript_37100/g.96182  ORF Transcript_37100/g.96182 Transcript_37100/m.96182 type:complete len:216 (+) Transcript_37100:2408-3055(+)